MLLCCYYVSKIYQSLSESRWRLRGSQVPQRPTTQVNKRCSVGCWPWVEEAICTEDSFVRSNLVERLLRESIAVTTTCHSACSGIFSSRVEAIASRMEAIATRLEALLGRIQFALWQRSKPIGLAPLSARLAEVNAHRKP